MLTRPKTEEPDIGGRMDEQLMTTPKSDHANPSESEPLLVESEAQVNERTCKRTRDRIFFLLCVSALVDTMGAALFSPALAMAVSRAPGAVPPADGVHKDAFPSVPVSFSLAVNFIGSALVLGGVFSSLAMGPASDKLGRKPLILVGLLGGALGYFCMWMAAAVFRSYNLFVGAMFVNGLFSGTKGVMMSYFADVYSPEEFGSKQPIFGMFALTGGTAGGICGGIFIAATGSLWLAAWVGVFASLFFAAAVGWVMPSDSKSAAKLTPEAAAAAKKTDAEQPDDGKGAGTTSEQVKPELPATVKRVLLTCIFAGALDSLGDEGNRFARSTIMPQTYPVTKEPSVMSLIGSSNVLATALCMFLVMGTSKKVGLAVYTVFGNLCSMIVQYSLIFVVQMGSGGWQLGAFITIWWLGQLFGFTSSMAQMILVGQTAPKEERGFWTGMSGAAGNLVKFIGPLALALVYGEENRAVLALSVCGTISLVAMLAYVPLLKLLPPPAKKELTLEPMEVYERMEAVEFMNLPLQVRWMISQERAKLQKPHIMHGWGKYGEQRPHLLQLLARSTDDFAFLKGQGAYAGFQPAPLTLHTRCVACPAHVRIPRSQSSRT